MPLVFPFVCEGLVLLGITFLRARSKCQSFSLCAAVPPVGSGPVLLYVGSPHPPDALQPRHPARRPHSFLQPLLLWCQPPVSTTQGNRTFSIAAPTLWNSRPKHIGDCTDLPTFKSCKSLNVWKLVFTWNCVYLVYILMYSYDHIYILILLISLVKYIFWKALFKESWLLLRLWLRIIVIIINNWQPMCLWTSRCFCHMSKIDGTDLQRLVYSIRKTSDNTWKTPSFGRSAKGSLSPARHPKKRQNLPAVPELHPIM